MATEEAIVTGELMATSETIVTGELMATREAIVTGELMSTGEAEVQSVQTTLDGEIVASHDFCFTCWPSSKLEFSLVYISCLSVGPRIGYVVNNWAWMYACIGSPLC